MHRIFLKVVTVIPVVRCVLRQRYFFITIFIDRRKNIIGGYYFTVMQSHLKSIYHQLFRIMSLRQGRLLRYGTIFNQETSSLYVPSISFFNYRHSRSSKFFFKTVSSNKPYPLISFFFCFSLTSALKREPFPLNH